MSQNPKFHWVMDWLVLISDCAVEKYPDSHTAWMLHFSHINVHNIHVKKIVWLDSCLPMAFLLPELKFRGFWSLSALPRDCSSGTWTEEHTRYLQSGAFTTVPKSPVSVSLNQRIQAFPQTQRLNCWICSTKRELELWKIAGFLKQSYMLWTNPSLPIKRAV